MAKGHSHRQARIWSLWFLCVRLARASFLFTNKDDQWFNLSLLSLYETYPSSILKISRHAPFKRIHFLLHETYFHIHCNTWTIRAYNRCDGPWPPDNATVPDNDWQGGFLVCVCVYSVHWETKNEDRFQLLFARWRAKRCKEKSLSKTKISQDGVQYGL